MIVKRRTKGKQSVLEILKSESQALSIDEIKELLNTELDRTTIYRILQSFVIDGLVHQIVDDNGKFYYALCESCCSTNHIHSDDHAHFKCLICGRITCLEANIIVNNIEQGYTINEINCLLTGVCKLCK